MIDRRLFLAAGVAAMVLAGCDQSPSKAEILKKAEGVKTKAELEKVLGKPAELDKVGPIEKWTYKASDGSVTYIIVADQVTLDMTGGSGKK
ncbi:hypothetical protein [Reyranella sp. CPCC 100927]|uniref:hypothetical protein n=1 Tax=Reyranella sp. CPCC 100927 TaxID=2599616 RepID=UPI0011B52A54|nr:hypothetical protein [Reyranella sp. CPCC 100927]TWT04043.1 hypothetical protein FQU96_27030 [Reyranella sp. CPCC 100927]